MQWKVISTSNAKCCTELEQKRKIFVITHDYRLLILHKSGDMKSFCDCGMVAIIDF